MAGSKLNNYSSTDNNITQMQLTEDASYIGKHNVTLTNMSTVAVPAIAGGSICEVNGALYKFSTDEPISTTGVTSTASGSWYIKLVPSSSQCTASFSTVNPVYRDTLQGWYESTSSNNRYINFLSSYSTSGHEKIKVNPSANRFFPKIIFESGSTNTSTAAILPINSTLYATNKLDFLSEISSDSITLKASGFYNICVDFNIVVSGAVTLLFNGLVYRNSTASPPIGGAADAFGPSVVGGAYGAWVLPKKYNYSIFLNSGDVLKFGYTTDYASVQKYIYAVISEIS